MFTYIPVVDLYHGALPYDFFDADPRSFHCMLYDPTDYEDHEDCQNFDGDGDCQFKCEGLKCDAYGERIVSSYIQSTLCSSCGYDYYLRLKNDPTYDFDSEDDYYFGEFADICDSD